jgi:hypothetical protein
MGPRPRPPRHLNTSLRTKMPTSSSSRTTMTMNSIMGTPLLGVGDEKAPGNPPLRGLK